MTQSTTRNKRRFSTTSSESEQSIILESDEISEFSDVENILHLITEDDEILENDLRADKLPKLSNNHSRNWRSFLRATLKKVFTSTTEKTLARRD